MTKEGVDGHGDVRETVGVRTDQEFWEEDGHSVVGNPMAAAAADDTIHISTSGLGTGVVTLGSDTVLAGQPVDYYSTYGAGTDSLSFTSDVDASDWVEKHGGYEWTPGTAWPPTGGTDVSIDTSNYDMADVDDQRAHHFATPEVFGNDYSVDQLEADRKYQESMMPGISTDHRQYIYESPDGGNTVYRRKHGQDPMTRELVPQKDSKTGVRPDGDFARVFYKYKEDVMLDEAKNYIATTYGSHYTSNDGIQTLDLIQGIGDAEAFCRSNAIKYLSRFGKKEGKSKVDILKAIHYCTLLYHFAGLHDEN